MPRLRRNAAHPAAPRRTVQPSSGVPATIRVRTADNVFQHVEVLKRNRTKRHRFGEFFVEGVRAINAARRYGWDVHSLVYAPERPLSRWAQETIAETPHATRVELPLALMERLSEKEDASELLAVVGIPADDLACIPLGDQALVVVFDRPTNPGNLGSIIRSCDALGAHGLIVTGHGADVYDPQTVRASMGSLFALPVVRLPAAEDVWRWAERIAAEGPRLQIVGGSGDGALTAEQVDFTQPTILVVGNETEGLSKAYRELCDTLARIPMAGSADSLNVACAASILLYEAARQRRRSA